MPNDSDRLHIPKTRPALIQKDFRIKAGFLWRAVFTS